MAGEVLKVQLSADAYLVCLTHALSAEKEEVMGVLLGEVHAQTQTRRCTYAREVWLGNRRSDKFGKSCMIGKLQPSLLLATLLTPKNFVKKKIKKYF